MEGFRIADINDKIFSRMAGRSYKVNCQLPLGDLRYLELLHKNETGETLRGEMICNARIATAVLEIFERLFRFHAHLPHERIGNGVSGIQRTGSL